MADIQNTLQLAVEIDTSDAKKKTDELSKKLSEMLKELDSSSRKSTGFSETIGTIDDLDRTIGNLQKRLKSLQNVLDIKAKSGDKLAIKNTKNEIDDLKESLEGLRKIQDELINKPIAVTTARIAEAASGGAIIKGELPQRALIKTDDINLKRVSPETIQARKDLEAYNNAVAKAQEALKLFELSLDPVKYQLYQLDKALDLARQEFVEFSLAENSVGMDRAKQKIQDLKKQIDDVKNSTKESASWWDILLARIRNIGIYRIIRTVMKEVTQLIVGGFDRLTKLSAEASKVSSELQANYNLIATSLGATINTLLQPLMPIINSITDVILMVTNAINKLLAQLSGADHYLKVVRKDIGDVSKESNKFSFDKFEALQPEDKDLSGVAIEEIKLVDEGIQSSLSGLRGISEAFEAIANIIGSILDMITTSLSWITEWASPFLDMINSALTGVSGMVNIISGLFKLMIGDWKGATDLILKGLKQFGASFINMLIDSVNIIISTTNLILKPIDWIAQLFGAKAGTVQIPKIQHVSFADGGFTTANFIATNENGRREWVGRNAGATAVVNDTQMSDIMYQAVKQGSYEGIIQAMYETDFGGGSSSPTELVVDNYTLGKVVASSAGFRDEFNRRNVGLLLRGGIIR